MLNKEVIFQEVRRIVEDCEEAKRTEIHSTYGKERAEIAAYSEIVECFKGWIKDGEDE